METKLAANDEQCYEDFEPFCLWKKEEGFHILEVHLPGFKRHDVRVQINNQGILTISGKQPMEDETTSTRSRFRKEIKISKECNEKGIRAKFSHGILSVVMPKKDINLSTHLPEHLQESAGSGSGEKSTTAHNAAIWSSVNYYLLGLRSKILRPNLSKEIALKTMMVSLVVALGGYAIYRYPKPATVQT